MTVEVSTYVDVSQRIAELGFNQPNSLAILPRNFDTASSKEELVHESSTPTVRSLWRQNDIIETQIETDEDNILCIQENSFEWLGPTIFVPILLLSQDPYIVTVALNVISDYLTVFLRGVPGSDTVRLNIVKEEGDGKYTSIKYVGSKDGLKDLPAIARSEGEEKDRE